jgi:rhamnose transport system ATP-binding protein
MARKLRDGAHVETRATAGLTQGELIRLMVGREVTSVYPERVNAAFGDVSAPPALEARGLGCRASGIHDVSLTLRTGEVVGLFGLVHSGRTELARMLFGITPADSGTLSIGGKTATVTSPLEARALGVAYVPEDRRQHGVVGSMSVSANATMSILDTLHGGWLIDRGRETTLARSYVERLQIKTASLDAEVGTLSGGNQQKVALARSLATEPRVLILDEPTQGVDVGAKAEIHRQIADLKSRGLSVLLISSEVQEILGMSDRIAVMNEGTIVAVVDAAEATAERLLAMALPDSGVRAHAV